MHYYQFNIGDYRKQTSHLTLVEHGIYRSLLDSYYLSENALTCDLRVLQRAHSIRTDDEKQALNDILEEFFLLSEDGYKHAHCDEELARIYKKSESARKSAKARWAKKDANGMREVCERIEIPCERIENGCESDATQHPLPKDPLPNNNTVAFEDLWETFNTGYGAKGSKKNAKAQFKKIPEDKYLLLTTALKNQISAKQAAKGAGEFYESFPHVERWLRNERYNDVLTSSPSTQEYII